MRSSSESVYRFLLRVLLAGSLVLMPIGIHMLCALQSALIPHSRSVVVYRHRIPGYRIAVERRRDMEKRYFSEHNLSAERSLVCPGLAYLASGHPFVTGSLAIGSLPAEILPASPLLQLQSVRLQL